ncbi:MAG: hypothetical protein JSS82_17565 [Bacteroidetes bacterium]|nr:hypothetical protein [Bacteroidota bacterium]
MTRKFPAITLLTCLLWNVGKADIYIYDYDANCSKAYEYVTAMRFGEARNVLVQEMRTRPNNLMTTFIGNYEDCLTLLFNGDKKDMEQRSGHLEDRLELLSRGNQKDPWYRFCKAGINLQWALVYIRMGENLKAVTLFRKSYLLLKENRDLFPSFEYNNVYLGLEQATLGGIPEDYKWVASLFGMKGDVRKGVGLLAGFISKHHENDLLEHEAIIYYAYLRFYLMSQHDEVWAFLNKSNLNTQGNLLNSFVKANIALNNRKADDALRILKEASREANYGLYPVFDYETGNALFYKLDPGCVNYYQRFINNYKGRTFVKDAWQKMSLAYYLQQNQQQAERCRQQVLSQGTTQVDADKQAVRTCKNEPWPNMGLLQARLLTDGGFYKQAFEKISSYKETDYKSMSDKLEYFFRLGRIYDELNDDKRAIQYYQYAINMGKQRPEHFAARSALQIGFIYERGGQAAQALASYQLALSMRGHDYQASIDQQAKAGVNRLSGK